MKEELQFEKAFLLEGHTGNVSCAKFNPKAGQLLASCCIHYIYIIGLL